MRNKILIFFIIGLIIYVIDIGFNSDNNLNEIYISDSELTNLLLTWKSQVGREPTAIEATNIINNLVEEEILYREALKLGLDNEDRIIKRRLAQKITFLKQETLLKQPSDEVLRSFYNLNKNKYFVQPLYSFTHLYFSKGPDSKKRADKALKELIQNKTPNNSDPFLLGKEFYKNSTDEIIRNFGKSFENVFNKLILDQWSGPYESSYGHHLIFLNSRKDGFNPDWIEIKNQVLNDYFLQSKEEAIKKYLEEIKSEYKVVIDPNFKY